MTLTATRILNLIALLCVAAVAVALISQHVFDLRPCAWCVLQRLIYLTIAVVSWLGVLLARLPGIRRLAALVATCLSVSGFIAAWYQYTVAAKLFSCDLTFADRFIVKSGLDAHVPWLFGIFASCMDARVNLLGVEYAIWSLALFGLLALLGLAALLRRA
ncbi:disulfide bond formation protein B [Eoetvoesiella caeni]|uniref:Thiol:disulfide interchange protein DsbB n=1 Tax=Eoetvoesiella caeni TaxID=645616 RepID=A0A366HKE6_9BURK|nr:disulfide bond formation protein B [Eoetvoesiella caeni]MCI2807565.1 disulfide bond formation protein B [Eoetvoesiella caeni]NYT53040.1 disulfide bond formation protein B [Eoetvoesiella caeni]RBP43017.1 thiol:disulfide interchange protein DsbB [Eoetvoesiella caeni]